MKKKKLIAITCAVALIGAIGIGSTLAYFTDSAAATNVVTMGHVDIDLTEEDANGTKYTDGMEFTSVLPGATLDKIAYVTVASGSSDAYIRVKATYDYAGTTITATDMQAVEESLQQQMQTKGWVYSTDGYYYYMNTVATSGNVSDAIVSAGDQIGIINTVTIPTAWGNNTADQEFSISFQAEAIQADNFTPSFDGNVLGWNGVTAETYSATVTPAQ